MNPGVHLLIDCGNSRLKWAMAVGGQWRSFPAIALTDQWPQQLARAWTELAPPAAVWVSCVAGAAARQTLTQLIAARWQVSPHFVSTTSAAGGVTNRYRVPEQLGADRWLALIGARALTERACCVVDCGTAIKVDALSDRGEFVGGVILPGLALARAALLGAAPALRSARGGDDASCSARSTADAIAAGTRFGLAGAIERVVREHEQVNGAAMEVLLTGGDAPTFLPLLSRSYRHEPELVLRGLAQFALA